MEVETKESAFVLIYEGMSRILPPSINLPLRILSFVQEIRPKICCKIAREVLREVFYEHIVDYIALDATLCTLLKSTNRHHAVRADLRNNLCT